MTNIEQRTMEAVQALNRKAKDQTKIDWEQRQYEIAKAMMPYCMEDFIELLHKGVVNEKWKGKTIYQIVAENAVHYADELIDELKNKRNNGENVGVIDHTPRFVKIKKLYDDIHIPQKQHLCDAAFDIFTPKDTELHKGRNLIPLGFAIELPYGYAALIRSRSGFSLKGMESANGERFDADVITGLIDENYRGEVGVIIYSKEDFTISKGTRIGQILPYKVPNVEFVEVEELSNSERGESGYGSTGK